jgi:hypothetical protein
MSPAPATSIAREPASFRDPAGFVFSVDGEYFRAVGKAYESQFAALTTSGLASELMERQLMLRFEDAERQLVPGAHRVLRPQQLRFVSYPYEWSFSQLKDAAFTTLRVQRRALDHGMVLKDASAYNIQFVNGRPLLIDTLSFDHYREGAPWVAYRQFCQHFLAPLALMAHCDVRAGQFSRLFIDGTPLDFAAHLLPLTTRARPSLAAHIHLHARAQRTHAATPARKTATLSKANLIALIENLAAAVHGLTWSPKGTEWADYYDDTNYTEASMQQKVALVGAIVEAVRPGVVWDLGANTGRFSRLGSERGAFTIAFDVDPAAVERHYLECRTRGEERLLPLLMDLTNPSPGIGWSSGERRDLASRGPADLLMALALVHHLAIGNNVPFAKIAAWFARLGRHLVIEFVPKTDSQVQRLLASREDVFADYTEPAFTREFGRYFEVVSAQPIQGSERVLYHMRRRDAPQDGHDLQFWNMA